MVRSLIVIAFFVFPHYCLTQSVNVEINSSKIDKYLKAIITYDSTDIWIKKGTKVINRFTIPKDYYLLDVYYDRITTFISFNKCHRIADSKKTDQWTYELVVWDFSKNKTWSIDTGRSHNGEGIQVQHMCNYNPYMRSGIMISYGWESVAPYKYYNGKITHGVDINIHNINIMAIFNEDSILVQTDSEGFDLPFYSYNYETGQKFEVDSQHVYEYSNLMLSQFGKNIHYYYDPTQEISFYNSDWNSEGSAVVYETWNEKTKKKDFYFYHLKDKYLQLISTGEIVFPIWK